MPASNISTRSLVQLQRLHRLPALCGRALGFLTLRETALIAGITVVGGAAAALLFTFTHPVNPDAPCDVPPAFVAPAPSATLASAPGRANGTRDGVPERAPTLAQSFPAKDVEDGAKTGAGGATGARRSPARGTNAMAAATDLSTVLKGLADSPNSSGVVVVVVGARSANR
ncbi:hypothetical protein LA345_13090 [Burkholderia vietnamiensis]|uniref:Uncharacterized protein n=1 Tax=Burkholderia vietnamiensis (strain G4 / LMG 22486) TaxID=269482 RepID=A4JFN4_BURVG|nr:hypothetical protein Bcep1808_2085 [Burkholderia vietnamiensis G4]MCB4344848.1 hypothetical protein [Burkholderia vietnamiensis]